MITAIHRFGPEPCKQIAFWYDEEGANPNMLEAERVRLPDGSTPEHGSVCLCGSCGREIHPQNLDYLPGRYDQVSVE